MEAHQRDEQRQAVAEEGQHRQRDDHERHAGLEVDGHQHDLFDPLAEVGGEKAQCRPERRGDDRAEEGDQQAHADRHDEPREHVAAEFVGAQQMGPGAAHQGRWRQPRLEIEGGDGIGHEKIRAQRRHDHQGEQASARVTPSGRIEEAATDGGREGGFGDGHAAAPNAPRRCRARAGSSQP